MSAAAKQSRLYRHVRSKLVLRAAWNKVASNGRNSDSPRTKAEVEAFGLNASRELEDLRKQLASGNYTFGQSRAFVIDRDTEPRPLVVAAVRDRIVQRALLDALSSVPAIRKLASSPTSFGIAHNGGVASALRAVTKAIEEGYTHFARSDIHGFYRYIVRADVIARMSPHLPADVLELLTRALNSPFDEESIESRFRHLFPTEQIGVAQGSSLSTLSGNVLLSGFDAAMNDRGVRCIRYADDFILLAKSPRRIRAAMRSALKQLDALGLKARDPFDVKCDPRKAQHGEAPVGFDFLGCRVQGTQIAPTSAAKKKVLDLVRSELQSSLRMLQLGVLPSDPRDGLATTMAKLHASLHAWGKAFAFCTDTKQIHQLDAAIDEALGRFLKEAAAILRKQPDQRHVRLMLGIGTLASTLDGSDVHASTPTARAA